MSSIVIGKAMFDAHHASIAVFGYRRPPEADAKDIVHAIDAVLQKTDAEPRKIRWSSKATAFIDRIGVRIAIGLLPPTQHDHFSHLVIAVGKAPGASGDDDILSVSHAHLADRLVFRIKDDMPYDTIMRGETPEHVDDLLLESLFDLLQQAGPAVDTTPANTDAQPYPAKAQKARIAAAERFDEILAEDVLTSESKTPEWLERRAVPTKPLRLTVHTMALSIMFYTAPLGAFLFTYSMLRDVTSSPA